MAAPHTSKPCFFFLACASALLCWQSGHSAHVTILLFLFGVCLRPLTTATWLFPHTSQPCFSFLACASALSQRRLGFSAHVIILLFLFGVCQCPLGLAKRTLRTRQNLAFSFWRVPVPSWDGEEERSAHVISLLLLFDVCQYSLATAKGTLRTRHFLAFSFWRVPPPSWAGEMAAPHTSKPCFFFLACASALLYWKSGRSAHVKTLLFLFDVYCRSLAMAKGALRTRHNLAFPFWRVPVPSWDGEEERSAHVISLLFLFGVCLRPLTTATWLFPHTSQSCFFFLTCASALLQRRKGCSAHVILLIS